MAMIRAHRNAYASASYFFFHNSFDYFKHIHIAC